MKYLYQTNKVLVIINLILGITVFGGLLFLIVLGISQIIMSTIIAYNNKKLSKKISKLFNFYAITTIGILITLTLMYYSVITTNSVLLYSIIVVSIIMAFLNLRITYLLKIL